MDPWLDRERSGPLPWPSTVPMSSSPPRSGLRRRHWLVAVPLGLVAVGVLGYRWSRSGSAADDEAPAFESIAPGHDLGRWTVVRVGAVHLGAVPVVLQTRDGQRYQVDVLARDPQGPPGVAQTERLSLFVVNSHASPQDDGQRPTDEEQGLGAMALAHALAREAPPPGLLTLRQRSDQHPNGSFAVSLQ